MHLATRTSVHVVSAAVVMGAWAAFANRVHGASAAMTAALVQAAASAIVTFGLKTAIEHGAARLGGTAAFLVPPLVASTIVLALLAGAHAFAGTRELWTTVTLPFVASFSYAWIYAALLAHERGERPVRSFNEHGPIQSSDLNAAPPRRDGHGGRDVSDGNAAARQRAVILPHGSDDVAGGEYIQEMGVESTGALGRNDPVEPSHPRGGGTEVPP